jgi:hypothetical protein
MKCFLSILLIVLLSGCSFSAGTAAKKIGAGVKKCCTSLCISKPSTGQSPTLLADDPATLVSPVIVLEQGHILTW